MRIDYKELDDAASSLGISKSKIPKIVISGSGRVFLGSHWPPYAANLRFSRLNTDSKSVIRLSRIKNRTERLNLTIAHELIHETQSFYKSLLGKVVEYGLLLSFAYLSLSLSDIFQFNKLISLAAGIVLGWRLGWRIAPHEIEARRRAPELAEKYRMVTK